MPDYSLFECHDYFCEDLRRSAITFIVPLSFEQPGPAQKMRDFRNLSDFVQKLWSLFNSTSVSANPSSGFIFRVLI